MDKQQVFSDLCHGDEQEDFEPIWLTAITAVTVLRQS